MPRNRFRFLATLVIAACAAMPAPAPAQNIGFLTKGPVAYMNEADKALLMDAFRRALNESADGDVVEWANPDSDSRGRIELLDTHADYGTTCRTVRTHSEARGRDGGGIYRLCQADDGTWQFAPRRRNENS